MTILEMLDRLEAEILALRSGQFSFSAAEAGKPETSTSSKRKSRRESETRAKPHKAKTTKRVASKKPANKTAGAGEQMALPAATASEETATPITGKRRALGRSLVHLRKLAAAARETSS